ncbi:unnamed protein product [Scytosiphon promiscuus]
MPGADVVYEDGDRRYLIWCEFVCVCCCRWVRGFEGTGERAREVSVLSSSPPLPPRARTSPALFIWPPPRRKDSDILLLNVNEDGGRPLLFVSLYRRLSLLDHTSIAIFLSAAIGRVSAAQAVPIFVCSMGSVPRVPPFSFPVVVWGVLFTMSSGTVFSTYGGDGGCMCSLVFSHRSTHFDFMAGSDDRRGSLEEGRCVCSSDAPISQADLIFQPGRMADSCLGRMADSWKWGLFVLAHGRSNQSVDWEKFQECRHAYFFQDSVHIAFGRRVWSQGKTPKL